MALSTRLRPIVAIANLSKEPPLARMNEREIRQRLGIYGATLGRLARNPREVAATNTSLALEGRSIAARIYRPATSGGARPLIVYYHGGGWVSGDLDSHDRLCRCLARECEATVVAVDYRLAPEHRFPAAADDAYDALVHLASRVAELGADGSRIFVAGDSAGGNLAAVTAIRARDAKGPALAGQLLLYPVVAADFDTASYRANEEGYVLTRERMIYFWETYVPDPAQRRDPRVAPLASDLGSLPKALVVTAGHDVLCTEGQDYAERLKGAGVPVERLDAPTMIHGYVSMPGLLPEADEAIRRIGAFVRHG